VITTWWVYRGLRKGLYGALNIFLVFFLPLLFTLNYFDLLFGLVGKLAPQSSLGLRQAISFCGTYLLVFSGCLYLCLWLCAEKLQIHRVVDGIGGAVFGAATGIISSGVLFLFWFSMPFAERDFPVDDAQMFLPSHTLTMKAATFMANRGLVRGARSFSGIRFMRDLRYGLPYIPTLGRGYAVLSIPSGLKIFLDAGGGSPMTFLLKIKERLNDPEMDIPPSKRKLPFGERSFTPHFVEEERGVKALVGIVMDEVPAAITDVAEDKMFVHDGEVFYSKEQLGDQVLFIKIYQVERLGGTGSVIGLFQPQDPMQWDVVKDYLPTQPCFKFDERELGNRLVNAGATMEETESLLRQVRLGGKAFFIGRGKEPMVVEMTGPKEWRIFSPEAPDVEAQKRNRARGTYY
jgi:hypothetical protein